MQLDVVVVDPEGRPVTNLKVDDFEVFERGELRPITTFAEVVVPSVVFEDGHGEFEPDIADNALPDGRLYVFVLDEVSPVGAMRARTFLRDFIERHFGPSDLGAVVLVGRGLAGTGQDFTRSPARLLAAIDRYSGGFPDVETDPFTSAAYNEYLRINQLAALRALVESVATIPGRRKAVLYVTEHVGVDMLDIVDY